MVLFLASCCLCHLFGCSSGVGLSGARRVVEGWLHRNRLRSLGCTRKGSYSAKGVFLPCSLLSAFYNSPPSKNPSKNLCLYWNPYQAPSKNPSKKPLLVENLLRTLLRSVWLHDPLGVRPNRVLRLPSAIEPWLSHSDSVKRRLSRLHLSVLNCFQGELNGGGS